MKKNPETQKEWIKYGNIKAGARKRIIPVVEILLDNIELMWKYEYQAKITDNEGNLKTILASNSLINLKKEIKNRKYKSAWITTSHGKLSYGQYVVDEYLYVPRY